MPDQTGILDRQAVTGSTEYVSLMSGRGLHWLLDQKTAAFSAMSMMAEAWQTPTMGTIRKIPDRLQLRTAAERDPSFLATGQDHYWSANKRIPMRNSANGRASTVAHFRRTFCANLEKGMCWPEDRASVCRVGVGDQVDRRNPQVRRVPGRSATSARKDRTRAHPSSLGERAHRQIYVVAADPRSGHN